MRQQPLCTPFECEFSSNPIEWTGQFYNKLHEFCRYNNGDAFIPTFVAVIVYIDTENRYAVHWAHCHTDVYIGVSGAVIWWLWHYLKHEPLSHQSRKRQTDHRRTYSVLFRLVLLLARMVLFSSLLQCFGWYSTMQCQHALVCSGKQLI